MMSEPGGGESWLAPPASGGEASPPPSPTWDSPPRKEADESAVAKRGSPSARRSQQNEAAEPPIALEPIPHLLAPKVPWPEEAKGHWRCEIIWRSGYLRSEFRAVVEAPDKGKPRVIATSSPFRFLFKEPIATPLPAFVEPVRDLAAALKAQGWTPVPRGGRWYSLRFIWNREGTPPDSAGG